jgi:hypothetical protein
MLLIKTQVKLSHKSDLFSWFALILYIYIKPMNYDSL